MAKRKEEKSTFKNSKKGIVDINWRKQFFVGRVEEMEGFVTDKGFVWLYLVEHMDKKNKITATQEEISKDTGVCIRTVKSAISLLEQRRLVVRVRRSTYMINPNRYFEGENPARLAAITEFERYLKEV